jgi:hypothetical protein
MPHSSPPVVQRQPLERTGGRVVTLGATGLVCLGGCAIATDGAIAYDPVGAYIFLLLAIAAACYLLTQIGHFVKRLAQLTGEIIVLAGRIMMVAVLLGAALTMVACAALT